MSIVIYAIPASSRYELLHLCADGYIKDCIISNVTHPWNHLQQKYVIKMNWNDIYLNLFN